jgi:hypothetical protein
MGNTPVAYEQKANDVMAVINAVTRDSVTILGFSDDAYTGYKVASMYPARVKKINRYWCRRASAGFTQSSF